MSALGYDPPPPPPKHQTVKRLRRQRHFLRAYAQCGIISEAAKIAKVDRSRHFCWLVEDPTYPARFQAADKRFDRAVEDVMNLVGIRGVTEPVLFRGKPVYDDDGQPLIKVSRDTTVLLRIAESRMEKYKRRVEQTNILEIDPSKLTDDQLGALIEELVKRTEAKSGSVITAPDQKQLPPASGATIEVESEPVQEKTENHQFNCDICT